MANGGPRGAVLLPRSGRCKDFDEMNLPSAASLTASGALIAAFSGAAPAFELDLPIRIADVGYQVYGVAPFGYHVAEHSYDGHPGLDFEYVPGAKVYASIGGSLQVFKDSHSPDKLTLQLNFTDGGKNYRLVYTNVSQLEAGVADGATVVRGQALGTAGSQTLTQSGGVPVTYAMTHFQLDDFSFNYGLTNATAVSPVRFFSAAAQADLASIWSMSAYRQMLCEPHLTGHRGLLANPAITRTWSRTGGDLANRIDFRCDFASGGATDYALYDADGGVTETGTVAITPVVGGNTTLDLTSAGGTRKGIVFAKDTAMRIAYSAPGGVRPADFAGASEYASGGPATNCSGLSDAVCFSGNASPYRPGDALEAALMLDWSKLTRSVSTADLWLALQYPSGALLFLDGAGNWGETAVPHRTGLPEGTATVPVIPSFSVSADIAGTYTLYAVIMETGSVLEQLDTARVSNIAAAVYSILGM